MAHAPRDVPVQIKCPACATSKTVPYSEKKLTEYVERDTKTKCASCGEDYRVSEAILAVFLAEKRRRQRRRSASGNKRSSNGTVTSTIPPTATPLVSSVAFQIATELGNAMLHHGVLSRSELIGIFSNVRNGLKPADNPDVVAVQELLDAVIRAI